MTFINIISTIGVASVVIGLLYIGRKLQILDDLKVVTDKIKLNVKVVSDFLTRSNANFNPSELQAYSPLRLTAEGQTFINDIGFDKIFDEHKIDFFNYIDGENPKLKYDVEMASIRSVSALYEKDYMNFLKVFLYNKPQRNIDNTAPTLGVYIRDKYLAEHPEITE